MKKILKSLLLLTSTLALTLPITGCFDPLFEDIMKAVEPENTTVAGLISSVTRYTVDGKEYLVTAGSNPDNLENERGLRYKLASANSHGQWKTFPEDSLPFTYHEYDYYETQGHTGQQILKILADEENLYIVTCEYYNNTDEGTSCPTNARIWQTTMTLDENEEWVSGEWTNVVADTDYLQFYTYGDYTFSAFSAFCTNSPNPAHRFAYIRKGNTSAYVSSYRTTSMYKLNGAAAPTAISVTPIDADSDGSDNIKSAVYYASSDKALDGVIFFNALASATNESADKEATRFYYAAGDDCETIYYSEENSSTVVDPVLNKGKGVGDSIVCLAVNADSILIGKGDTFSSSATSTGGIQRVELDSTGKPASELGSFSTNAQSQLLSSYIVSCLLSVDPSKAELENTLYAALEFTGTGSSSNVSYKKLGLWAYYPERGNWNRE